MPPQSPQSGPAQVVIPSGTLLVHVTDAIPAPDASFRGWYWMTPTEALVHPLAQEAFLAQCDPVRK
jgi:hypothetical protein